MEIRWADWLRSRALAPRDAGGGLVRRCPRCQSQDVQRSSFHHGESSWYGALSPYHCDNCSLHFTVVSQSFHRVLVVGATVLSILALMVVIFEIAP